MPLYEYIAVNEDEATSCPICRKGFELNRPVDRPALDKCPLCRHPVRKLVSRVHSPRILKPLSVTDAKQAGFTVLERRGKGEYEKL